MRSAIRIFATILLVAASFPADAATLRIATWNLGWHVAQSELSSWIAHCSQTFAKDPQGVWRVVPAGTAQAKRGWDIAESRATLEGVDLSLMPPCAVYLTPAHQGIEVTSTAYAKRIAQLGRLLASSVRPDVIAFQEVSGTQAVLEALGPLAPDYHVCSFDGAYKVQRLAFAWKKRFGNAAQACSTIHAVSLPAFPKETQVRPAFSVTVALAGKQVRFVTVHLKSGCVSPLDGDALDGNTGPDDPCPTLQEQVAPLEGLFEGLGSGVDHFIVLGDFNCNLWHEANRVSGAEAVRSDGATDLTTPRAANVRTRNLLFEVNDGVPAESTAVLLSPSYGGSSAIVAGCEMAKTTTLSSAQWAALRAPDGLGCRNPVGLDHVLVSQSLEPAVRAISKVPIGTAGRSLGANPPDFPDPLLAVSDHCPLVAEIDF